MGSCDQTPVGLVNIGPWLLGTCNHIYVAVFCFMLDNTFILKSTELSLTSDPWVTFLLLFSWRLVSDIFIAPICGKQFTFLQREQCKPQFSISPSYFRLFQLYYLCIDYRNPRLSYLVFWNSIINRKPFKIELFTWFFFISWFILL